uniref:NADH dehydrogenase subunit 6 n=1 Tax=Perumytilus purpuratus TaxID=390823 RepID=A0A346KKZ3_PERPP|nr:NADH dehydrogenase subunit 6 [Perumytilus purpuratus]AXP84511.1 NADH dehydrogenase subunit 6 [Perumytilus purpuratus]
MLFFMVMELVALMVCMSLSAREPFMLGVSLVSCSLMVCIIMCKVSSSILSMLVFMSYVGGLMVLFLYVLSVHPNQVHELSFSFFFFFLFFIVLTAVGLIWYFEVFFSCPCLVHFDFVGMKSFYHLYLFMACLLLFALLVVCYLCVKKRCPLRSL